MATLSINDLSQNSGDVIITGTSDAENSQVLLEYDGDYYTGGVVGGEFFAPSNPTVIANNVTNASSQLVDNDAYCAEPHLWRLNNGNHIKVFGVVGLMYKTKGVSFNKSQRMGWQHGAQNQRSSALLQIETFEILGVV